MKLLISLLLAGLVVGCNQEPVEDIKSLAMCQVGEVTFVIEVLNLRFYSSGTYTAKTKEGLEVTLPIQNCIIIKESK